MVLCLGIIVLLFKISPQNLWVQHIRQHVHTSTALGYVLIWHKKKWCRSCCLHFVYNL